MSRSKKRKVDYTEPGLLARCWHQYRTAYVPPEAKPLQIRETHQAFSAGASILFKLMVDDLSKLDDDERLAALTNLAHECQTFGDMMSLRFSGDANPGAEASPS